MKIRCNRFAIIPVSCYDCHRYIWLEPYRKAEVYHSWIGEFIKQIICNECLKKYNLGGDKND